MNSDIRNLDVYKLIKKIKELEKSIKNYSNFN